MLVYLSTRLTNGRTAGFNNKDLTEDEIRSVFTLREAVAFSGLSTREFFAYEGYWNTDTFSLIAQRFATGRGGVSLVARRRDGNTTIGIPDEYFIVRQEAHIHSQKRFDLDDRFACRFPEGHEGPDMLDAEELLAVLNRDLKAIRQ
jgi:hypothetical protein